MNYELTEDYELKKKADKLRGKPSHLISRI